MTRLTCGPPRQVQHRERQGDGDDPVAEERHDLRAEHEPEVPLAQHLETGGPPHRGILAVEPASPRAIHSRPAALVPIPGAMDPLQQQSDWLSALGQVQMVVARVCLGAALTVGLALAVAGVPS